MDELIQTFHIDWKLMLAQVFNFGLVFLALYFLASKPLSKLIKERTEEITIGLLNAKESSQIKKEMETRYSEIIAKAKIEADKIFKDAKEEAIVKKTEILEDAKKEVFFMIESGKKSLEREKTKMVEDAKKEIVSLVIKTTEKMLGSQILEDSFSQKVTKELNTL